ncbi:MAG: PAS domain S-box protein, partial [Candidatus Omnitrophota bacterium]
YTREELLQQKFDMAADEENGAILRENYNRRVQGVEYSQYEAALLKKGGKEKVLAHFNARGVYDQNGKFVCSITVISDITERRKVEVELFNQRATAQRYLDIVGNIIVALDAHGRVTLINKTGCALLGYDQNEIIGRDWFEMCIPRQQSHMVRAVFDSTITNEQAFPQQFENLIVARDGTERLILWHNIQLNDGGRITGILSSGEDITLRKRSEEALVASEMQFRTLVERVPAITYIVSVDESHTPRYVSPQVQSFINVSPAEYLADPDLWWRMIHPDDAPGVRSQMMVQLAEHKIAVCEYRVRASTADIIWFRDEATVVTDSAGKSLFIQGIRYDITDLKEMQQSLASSRENFNNIIENIKDGIVICDKDGIIRFVNPAAEFLLNCKADGCVGKAFEFPLVEGKYAEINTVSGFGEPGIAELRVTKTAWASENMYLVMLHDITERKRAEERIRSAAKEWRSTFDSITDRIAIIDNNLMILRVNRAFADSFHKKPEELLSVSCRGLLRDAAECGRCPHKKAVQTKMPVSDEYYSFKDKRFWEVTCSPLFDEKGGCIAVIHISKDITMRKELEKNMRLAQLGKLVADMAHEVNNPLMIISGRAQLSLMEQINNLEVSGNLKTITDECQRAKAIIQRLLRFSKPGKNEFNHVDIHQCIESVVALLKHQYSLSGIVIACEFASGDVRVFADQNQMQEVFMNIMSNARDAMPGSGTLTIKTYVENDSVKIIFKDTGIGMSAEVMKELFEPFFTTKDKGTGLGLSVCYGIIKNHGGTLNFDSAPGQGTIVTIALPYANAARSITTS